VVVPTIFKVDFRGDLDFALPAESVLHSLVFVSIGKSGAMQVHVTMHGLLSVNTLRLDPHGVWLTLRRTSIGWRQPKSQTVHPSSFRAFAARIGLRRRRAIC
jgi:hypothetical protein